MTGPVMITNGVLPPTTISLIINGRRAADLTLHAEVGRLRERGIRVRPRVTFDLGDAAHFAAEESAAGTSVVVAVGGDGTINEVLNGLAGAETPMGIIPLGTANDFARQVGIPEDVAQAIDVILRAPPVRLDSASLNGRRFLNVSSAGLGAEATAETSSAAKATLGSLAYAITGLKKLISLDAMRLRLEAPGVEREIDVLAFFVGNARHAGGGMPVTPLASPNDGLLDVCVVERMGRAEVARLALKIRNGEQVGEPGVLYFRAPWLTVRSEQPISVNADGERLTSRQLDYRARPGDLLIHLPPRSEAATAAMARPPLSDEEQEPLPGPLIERREQRD